MKRINKSYAYAMTVVLVMLSLGVTAQSVSYGVKGGLNLTSLQFDSEEELETIAGYHAGLWFNAALPLGFSLQPELLFTQNGAERNYSFNEVDALTRLRLNYIQVPVHLVYNVLGMIDLEAGPYWGFLIGSDYVTRIENENNTMQFLQEIDREDFAEYDLGFSLGARIRLNSLQLGLRYLQGLQEVADNNTFNEAFLGDGKNQSFQVYVAIPF
ncbi:porin family protein [Roseimarinus sediminis]|uniref:porin family protein n=1 Tax=Roseimarinus sediminis TaxID=1610899 RepID=UPI003D230CCC